MARSRRARGMRSKPRSPCSGSKVRRCSGIESRERFRPAPGWMHGKMPGYLASSTWPSRTAISPRLRRSTTTDFWRPVTAIRAADSDGNPATVADPTWTPLAPTPPIPDHDSGHSVEGGAAAQVLKRFFGRDDIAFTSCSLTLPPGQTCSDFSPVLRSYQSFTQAARENAVSRILVGFHFRNAVEQGIEHGRAIGNHVVRRVLRPSDSR